MNRPLQSFLTLLGTLAMVAGSAAPAAWAHPGDDTGPSPVAAEEVGSWPMVGANPQRTSWTPEQVSGDLHVEWYRPIEAYISQNTQIIGSNGLLYISTARGLYALDAANGNVVWRFDTELPLGNSPTVADGIVYVGGYDRKMHALNARDGTHLWAFEGAEAGFSTNPLVVNGQVIAGNRDGYLYVIGAHGTAAQGQLIWKYKTGGLIDISAAYKDGVVYFASNDNYAYALNVDTRALVWKSAKLPGDGYQSFWPVVYQDKVIFSGATGYREQVDPGTSSLLDPNGSPYDTYDRMQKDDLFFDQPNGTIGPVVQVNEPWAEGQTVINGSRIAEYLEDNPNPDPHLHKPWRRTYILLNMSDGSEYTFDSDRDGYREYAPIAWWGTRSGNSYPPLVGPNGVIYQNNIYKTNGVGTYDIPQGLVMGWKIGTPYLSLVGGQGALDETQATSAGGTLIYRSICCDRVGDYFDMRSGGIRWGSLWHYNVPLTQLAPGYDQMWWGIDPEGLPRLEGNYGTKNGIYHNHGDQNPIIPYQGRLYIHRSNAIIAFGPGQGPGRLPLLEVNNTQDSVRTPSEGELKALLEDQVEKMVNAGHLRPGYYNAGQFIFHEFSNYFENPGDTLYTLTRAYPFLTPGLQQQTKAYLKNEFTAYFDPTMYARIGWAEGAAREAMPMPSDLANAIAGSAKSTWVWYGWPWQYPQHNLYAMWKYAQLFPADAGHIYDLAKGVLEVPANTSGFGEAAWEHNAYIAGYIGFLNLQDLAGRSTMDSALRTEVTNELNRLLAMRADNFSKDTPWIVSDTEPSHGGAYHRRELNLARNFMMFVPELGDYLYRNALAKVQGAIDEYNDTAPYWFVARYDAAVDEGARESLYDYNALFQAKAYALKEPREQLVKYLDAPAFERGDLFYIQNLVAAIEAQPEGPTPTFADVAFSHPYHDVIEALYQAGYTAGCNASPLMYCPEATMNRAESSVFVERGIHTASYDPPAPTSQVFADMPLDSWAAKWVAGLWNDQYTAGCGANPLVYCPWQGHTRAEGCVFYLRMMRGATYDPPQPTQQMFVDVPLEAWYAKWVQAGYEAGLLTACQTSPELRFCPNDPLTRALAAYMMVKAKGLH